MNAPSFAVCRDADVLAARLAAFIAECARDAVRKRGRFTIALSGGSTPEQTYAFLARPDQRVAIPWSHTHVFFSDERFVPHSDVRSNYAMARRTLLAEIPIPPSQVFPVPTNTKSAAAAAESYAEQLAGFFTVRTSDPPPPLDLILLGIGEDGHTASLLPGAPALREDRAWVTWSAPGGVPPFVDRITFTYPLINAARHVAILASGEKKAAVLNEIFDGRAECDACPASGVRPIDGTLSWFLDEAAARRLAKPPKH